MEGHGCQDCRHQLPAILDCMQEMRERMMHMEGLLGLLLGIVNSSTVNFFPTATPSSSAPAALPARNPPPNHSAAVHSPSDDFSLDHHHHHGSDHAGVVMQGRYASSGMEQEYAFSQQPGIHRNQLDEVCLGEYRREHSPTESVLESLATGRCQQRFPHLSRRVLLSKVFGP